MRHRVKVFFDGGCRPNPGRIEVAVVIRGEVHLNDALGYGTNGDAEWQALIWALALSRAAGLSDGVLIGDALAVIGQANRAIETGIAPHRHAAAFLAMAAGTPPARIRWIKRQQNLAGIALAARHPR